MIQSLNEKTWLKTSVIGFGIIAVIYLWAYLSGGLFLVAHNKPFANSTGLTLYKYWYYYREDRATIIWLYVCAGVSFFVVGGPIAYFFAPAKQTLFGTSRFAKNSEIEEAGLFGDLGIIIGQIGKRFLMFAGQQHVLVKAPTRGGKGVAIVIPNLLNFRDSVVCLDMKQENHDITSGYRKWRGQDVYLLNLAARDYRTHRWNCLGYISDDPNFRIDDIQKIAFMFFPDVQGTDPIWTATPRTLFLGIVLMLIETPGKLVTMGQVRRESLADGDGAEYFATLIAERAEQDRPFSRACINALNAYISIKADTTRTGIITSFRSRLELWDNPLIDAATSANDFDLRELRKKRMSIYIGFTPDNLERLQTLINLFLQQTIDLNIQELPSKNKSLKYSVLGVFDELTAFGKIPILSKGISFLAAYGIRVLTIVQSPGQLTDVYGQAMAENYGVNHAAQIIYAPKRTEFKVAEEISNWLGQNTVDGVSRSKGSQWFGKKSPTESTSDQKRQLMLPQEVMEIGAANEIIIMENVKPIRAKKAMYFKSPVMMDRLKEVSPSLAALGKKLPTQKQLEAAWEAGELRAPVPLIDLAKHEEIISSPENTYVPVKRENDDENSSGGKKIVERPVAATDVLNLKDMPLSAFVIDFSGIEKPVAGQLDEAGLKAYADKLSQAAGISI